jgi:hypothetical protein
MRLSQSHLTLLQRCPRQFQQTCLEQLGAPSTPEQQERLQAGSQFHLLMQQWEMNLPIAAFLQEDAQLKRWFNAFIDASPQILTEAEFCQSEHLRTLEVEGHVFTVIYDLLLLTPTEARILDWKTYPKPPQPEWLMQNWQSRLYPFVLAETSEYQPEQISMTYWFFQAQGKTTEPQSLKLLYDRTKHEATRQELRTLLTQLNQWYDDYLKGVPFPQVPESNDHCANCDFALRCERSGDQAEALLSLSAIAEVPLLRKQTDDRAI